MKESKHIFGAFLFVSVLCAVPVAVRAYTLRQFSNKDGLSNSAILSLCQDAQGILWIGTCDGLNRFDGTQIDTYSSVTSSQAQLSGSLINRLMEAEPEVLWVQANYGLDRLDLRKQTCQTFPELSDNNFITKSLSNTIFVLKDDGYLYYYRNDEQAFVKLETVSHLSFAHILHITIDADNILWIFTSNGDTRSYQITETGQEVTLSSKRLFQHTQNLRCAFSEGPAIYLVDDAGAFYEWDTRNAKLCYIADLKSVIDAHGEISSIIKQQDDYYIGFKSSGLMVLRYLPTQKIKYRTETTEIQAGIFCLIKDRFQDIIWIGTDGQGVYMCYNDVYSVTHTLLDTPTFHNNNPVRALFYDKEQTLWVGTKGSGIIRIPNYTPEDSDVATFEYVTVDNSDLTDNSVYCLAEGSNGWLWIGTEKGLNYYSYKQRKLNRLSVMADDKPVKYIHSIYQLNDTTLWLSTVGEGIVKIILEKDRSLPVVKRAIRRVLNDERMASNYFFTSFCENDSILWFGNRGYGVYRLNATNDSLQSYRFDDVANGRTVNDVFAICKSNQAYWLGTGSGVLRFKPNVDSTHPYEAELVSNGTVHGILEDFQKNLWISTNQGLIKYNPRTQSSRQYGRERGVNVTEYSDGAFYKDPYTQTLFFGGINGFVSIRADAAIVSEYMPDIHFSGLSVFGKACNLHDYLYEERGTMAFQIDYKQNYWRLDFKAVDYINGNNYSYYYKLEGNSNQWIECGTTGNAIFANLSPGEYRLLVKYKNNANGKESKVQKLLIRILPPWYLSKWAYSAYYLSIILLCLYVGWILFRYHRRKQRHLIERLNQEKQQEIHESKLRFFTNITHEFCTPLTLINGPCEKILDYPHVDDYVRKYARTILQNARKLNGLIVELLEFRRLETGHKVLSIQSYPLSEKLQSTVDDFRDLSESRRLTYQVNIEPDIQWNTDINCFNKIASNLISNAFKYTPGDGTITVTLKKEEEMLVLRVWNSGKGIAPEEWNTIFDHYKVLDAVETNGKDSRNGLGLAICKSMVTLLKGDITVESTPGKLTLFTVTLPMAELTEQTYVLPNSEDKLLPEQEETPVLPGNDKADFDAAKHTVMIIDDDAAMLQFVSEIFADNYNVWSFGNAADALAQLEIQQPDLIISDVMMPDVDGINFTVHIKQSKLWNHIPLILLSALHYEDEQMAGIEAGADVYITKPFNVGYIEKVVARLITRESDLKAYYSSVFSSFTVEDSRYIHKEDRAFLDKVLSCIDRNISKPDLSVELLSKELNYSTRQFYRKLKSITEQSPAEIIREYRMHYVERLLQSTNFTVEEIMYRTGFSNRSTFYKLFAQCFGVTPRQYREQKRNAVKEEIEKG